MSNMGVDPAELLRLLQHDMNSFDVDVQLHAVKRLGKLAKVAGPESARGQILGFVLEQTAIENPEDKLADEVLYNLSIQLGGFVPLVGGSEHAGDIIRPLAEIATTEETLVRDAAVAAINKVFAAMPESHGASDAATRTINRLSGEGDEPVWFTSKMSSCGVFAAAFRKLAPGARPTALEKYQKHCKDDLPMVRRAAGKALSDLAAAAPAEGPAITQLYELWVQLCGDVYDNVRLLAALAIGEILPKLPASSHEEALGHFERACQDKSWRVRLSLAKTLGKVFSAVNKDLATQLLVPALTALLQDHEAEVRGAACRSTSAVCRVVGSDVFAARIVPILAELSQDVAHDPELKVRTPLVQELTRLPSSLSAEEAMSSVLPILSGCVSGGVAPMGHGAGQGLGPSPADLQLMILRELSTGGEDDALNTSNVPTGVQRPWMKDRGNAEEREALVGVLVQGLEAPFLASLLEDVNWRVREAVVLCVPRVVGARGADWFTGGLEEPFYGMIEDKVAAVRRAAGQCLGDLSKQLGADQTAAKILPRLKSAAGAPNYQLRISAIESLGWLCYETAGAGVLQEVAATLTTACADSVANVRLAGVGSLARLAKVAPEDILQSAVVPQVNELLRDADDDVKHVANSILEASTS